MKDRLAVIGSIIGVLLGVLTIITLVYTAGKSDAKMAARYRRLCEHIAVLEDVTTREHANYWPSVYAIKGCDE